MRVLVCAIAVLSGLGLYPGAGSCPAQAPSQEGALRASDVQALGKQLSRWRDAVVEFQQESKSDRKLKLGAGVREALQSFAKLLEGTEKRSKVELLKSTNDLRAVLEASFDFGRAKTKPGDFFQGEFRQQEGGERRARVFKFGYYLPKKYPAEYKRRSFPLVISLPIRRDTGSWFGGNTHLKNLYEGSPLLEDHILFCPELPNEGDFTGTPASVEALYEWLDTLTFPLTEFLNSHHIDWNRIYLESGKGSTRLALFLATAAPRYFAGLIVRDPIDMLGTSAHNYHALPILALASPATKENAAAFQRAFESLGYTHLTLHEAGAEEAYPFPSLAPKVAEWIGQHRRDPAPKRLVFRPVFSEFSQHWWIYVTQYTVHVEDARGNEALRPWMEVLFDKEQNRVKVTARSIKSFNIRVNDDLLDLDKPVIVEVNGTAREFKVQRDLTLAIQPVLENDPQFITTYVLANIQVPREEPPGAKEGEDEGGGSGPGK